MNEGLGFIFVKYKSNHYADLFDAGSNRFPNITNPTKNGTPEKMKGHRLVIGLEM
ncbi:MAG TPA: hypothetical protein PKZ37_16765 [Gallionellaceae bacterium]|nr:hypothetical protein [Gallionellaceae bacterium]